MSRKLTYNSTYDEIGWSLRETLDTIEKKGETIELKYEMLLKYGRLYFAEGNHQKAYNILQQCSIHAIDNWVVDVKEMYYWSARCLEKMGNTDRALNGYLMLLEDEKNIKDETFLNEVLDRLNLYKNLSPLVSDYKKRREEELNNTTSQYESVQPNDQLVHNKFAWQRPQPAKRGSNYLQIEI
jgi:tetratricopeptide (TPR) repeat protein